MFLITCTFKPCVNSDFSFLWESQKFDPPQNQNPCPDWDKIWHGWLRQLRDPSCKISCKSAQGGFSTNRWNLHKNFYLYTYIFFSTHLQVIPLRGFLCAMAQMMPSQARFEPFRVKSLKLICNVFIQKIAKNYNGIMIQFRCGEFNYE